MTLRTALWQRILAFCLFGFMAFLSVMAILQSLPLHLTFFTVHGTSDRSLFLSGLCVLLLSSYWWLRTENYTLVATHESLTQKTGFYAKTVKWQDVAFYRMEPLRGTRECKIEPVLYDEGGKELLRPIAPIFVGVGKMDEQRTEFWRFVEAQMPGKKN